MIRFYCHATTGGSTFAECVEVWRLRCATPTSSQSELTELSWISCYVPFAGSVTFFSVRTIEVLGVGSDLPRRPEGKLAIKEARSTERQRFGRAGTTPSLFSSAMKRKRSLVKLTLSTFFTFIVVYLNFFEISNQYSATKWTCRF